MNERSVSISGVKQEAAVGLLHSEGTMTAGTGKDVMDAIPEFTEVSHPTFFAKYANINGNLVVHFFLPKTVEVEKLSVNEQQAWSKWWSETFPNHLSDVAKAHFEADYPRIVAKYTEEVASWWFSARGFGSALAPSQLLEAFLEKLNTSLVAQSGS